MASDRGTATTPRGLKTWTRFWRLRQLACKHDWRYDDVESARAWTGYIERCSRCGLLQQVPQ